MQKEYACPSTLRFFSQSRLVEPRYLDLCDGPGTWIYVMFVVGRIVVMISTIIRHCNYFDDFYNDFHNDFLRPWFLCWTVAGCECWLARRTASWHRCRSQGRLSRTVGNFKNNTGLHKRAYKHVCKLALVLFSVSLAEQNSAK